MEKQQNEALKQWLHRYGELQRDADRLYGRLDDLRGRVESARTAHLDGMPHGSRGDADRIGGIVAELEEIEREAVEAQEAATATRREIAAAIKRISGPRWADRREILRLRYLDGLRWEDAAEKMFGDFQDFWDRKEIYLRRSFKLHSQALEELSNYVPLQAGQEDSTERRTEKA
jgi:DNA-directed RNA polymerase specialized sigma24 family protein